MVKYEENAGDAIDRAIVIKDAKNHAEGVDAEYKYLDREYPNYRLVKQQLINRQGRWFDEMSIALPDGAKKTVYFDITEFYSLLMKDLAGE